MPTGGGIKEGTDVIDAVIVAVVDAVGMAIGYDCDIDEDMVK